nr:hypothetical protein [Tanacetum cinerariifolium]
MEDRPHTSLEGSRCIAEAKRHAFVGKGSIRTACDKASGNKFVLIVLIDGHASLFGIRRSRTGTELLANLCANLAKQCLQGVLNGSRKEHMAWQTDDCIMKEEMSILRRRKSVPGMNSSEREMERRVLTLDKSLNPLKSRFPVNTTVVDFFLLDVSIFVVRCPGECSSCGALYTMDYCCSDGSLEDKIICDLDKTPDLSQRSPQNCPKCGNPIDGHYCQGCAHYGYNCPPKVPVVPDLEPFNNQTVDELPQTLPSFDQTCYSKDGDSFTYDSTSNLVHDSPNVFSLPLQPPTYSYEFCGNDAYYGHDCSLQFLVIHQPIREKTYTKLLAEEQEANINTQPFQYSVIPQPPQEEMSVEFLKEKRNQMDSVKTFLRKFNRVSFYEMPKVLSLAWEKILEIELSFEDKHCQPKDILELFQRLHNDVQNIYEELAVYINTPNWDRPIVCYDNEDYTIAVTPSLPTEEPDNSLSMGDEHLDTVSAMESNGFIKSSVENLDFSDSNDESTLYNDDSFSIDNIEYVEASPFDSEVIGSEVMEIVIPEVGGIDNDILLTIKDDILRENLLNVNLRIANIKALNENPTPSSDFMTKSSSTSLNSLLEETNTFHNFILEFAIFFFDLEEISSGSTTTHSDISLPEYEAFYDDHVKEISSGSTTTHSDSSLYDSFIFDLSINPFPLADRSDFYEFADELAHIISPPEYDCFCFKNEPNLGDFTMDVVENIFPTREPRVHNALPTHPPLQMNLDFILSSEYLFAYVVWIFLPFLSYSVAP